MRFELVVTARYDTNTVKSKKEALELALLSFNSEIERWKKGKELAGSMWDVQIIKK